jgi:hypothetical protein
MKAEEIERYAEIARDYLKDKHPTPERVDELNQVFPAWLLANSVQMDRLRKSGLFREDFYALRHKLSADLRHRAKH